nr:hypothetical protein [Nocardia wallacei]
MNEYPNRKANSTGGSGAIDASGGELVAEDVGGDDGAAVCCEEVVDGVVQDELHDRRGLSDRGSQFLGAGGRADSGQVDVALLGDRDGLARDDDDVTVGQLGTGLGEDVSDGLGHVVTGVDLGERHERKGGEPGRRFGGQRGLLCGEGVTGGYGQQRAYSRPGQDRYRPTPARATVSLSNVLSQAPRLATALYKLNRESRINVDARPLQHAFRRLSHCYLTVEFAV